MVYTRPLSEFKGKGKFKAGVPKASGRDGHVRVLGDSVSFAAEAYVIGWACLIFSGQVLDELES